MKTKLVQKKMAISVLSLCILGVSNISLAQIDDVAGSSASSISTTQASDLLIGLAPHEVLSDADGQYIDMDSDTFLLSRSEWVNIQVYIQNSLSLPITQLSMINSFALPEKYNFDDFKPLLEQYKEINSTADSWNRTIYPSVVQLANNLANYSDRYTTFIGPLTVAINNLKNAIVDGDEGKLAQAKEFAVLLLNMLKDDAETRKTAADLVMTNMNTFNGDVEHQKGQLKLLSNTQAAYLLDDGSATKLQIANLQTRVAALNATYNQDVEIATTTLVYASIPILGWAIAPTIATVYGIKAEDARKERNLILEEVNELQTTLSSEESAYGSFQMANSSVTIIKENVDRASVSIGKIVRTWGEISGNIDSIIYSVNSINLNSTNTDFMYINLNSLDAVKKSWQVTSELAREFVQNAYVEFIEEDL